MHFGIAVSLAFLVGDGIAGQTFSRCTLEHLKQYGGLQPMGVTDGRSIRMLLQAVVVGVLGFALAPHACHARGAVFRVNGLTASMLARVAPRRPPINSFLAECRSGGSSFKLLIKGHT